MYYIGQCYLDQDDWRVPVGQDDAPPAAPAGHVRPVLAPLRNHDPGGRLCLHLYAGDEGQDSHTALSNFLIEITNLKMSKWHTHCLTTSLLIGHS